MINIFGDNKAVKKSRKVRRKSKKLSATEAAKLGQEKLEKLNPMVIPLLAVKSQESPNNEFLKSSISVITERPHSLTDKWVGSLNKWVDSIVAGVLLDEPEIKEGIRSDFGPLAVCNVVEAKMTSEYPMPAIICVDKRGWKWYFKTSKAHSFVVGETITFTATVSGHKEGITFLRRPSKIKKAIKIMAETKEGCDD